MKLKELHIFGFKSFADKTSLEFGQDITIIVGPNGSGKSNVFDSIRWVLGEQSAKQLRGGKMEDVIFIGSDSRKTLGMAEVSIVMDNTDKTINLPYIDVKVTRRLYRSGESEYFINDQPVRLKDIVEIFMDTGVGLDSYSIISQGEVDRIINAKPIERREIFEEAAGITKYIKKRDEALRKLEATEQNMLRINDILAEVKRQTAVLERQAKKAEQYKVLKLECSDMEIRMHKKNVKERRIKYKELEAQKAEIDKKIESEEAGLSTFEKSFEDMKHQSLEMEKGISEKREKWVIKQEEIKRLEDSLKYLSERHAELLQRIEALKNENIENVGKVESIKIDIENKKKAITDKETVIKEREGQLEDLNKKYDGFITEFDAAKRLRDDKQGFAEKLSGELNGLKGRVVELELNIKNLDEQLLKLENDKKESQEKLHMTEAELEAITANRGLKEEEIKGIKDREEELLKEKMRRKTTLLTTEETVKDLGLVISKLESRSNFLQQMQQRMEGYGEIVRKVLTEYKVQLDDSQKKDLVDVVANLIAVEKPYERAVEQTLAGLLQTVLIRNEKLIEEIFSLYEHEKGEISFINSNDLRVDYKNVLAGWKSAVSHKNILAYLPEQIEVEDGNEAIKLLFYNIFVVENIEKAKEVLAVVKKDEQYYLMTQNGELISNFNIYTKGEGLAGEGLLSRDREIEEIASEIENARGKYAAVDEERVFQAGKIEALEKEIENLSVTYHAQYVEVIKDDERMKQKSVDRERHVQNISRVDEQTAAITNDRTALLSAREGLSAEEKNIFENIEKSKADIEASKLDIQKKEEDINREKSVIDDKKVEIMTLRNDYEFEVNNKGMLENRLKEVETAYAGTNVEIEGLSEKTKQAEEESRGNEAKINEIKSSLAAEEHVLETAKSEYENFKLRVNKLDEDIKNMSKTRDRLKDDQYNVKVSLSEIAIEIKAIYDRMNEDFKIAPTDEEVYAVEIPEEEYKELTLKVQEYREKIDKLGVINLVAIEEYNELKSRNEHLQMQYDDLNTARENLKKIIKKANEESKEMFVKAFDEIKIKFAEVFKKMFNGGEADILLSDSENILESGIDIIARPPGKKLQNISLLSGGEKAITAVSLLFALFLTKASPFCVMDEIDAPLDDINVTRFTNLVKSFKKTQFIIISHNKLTMAMGDVIYGVSMEKAGVSQIISIKLEKDREKIAKVLAKEGRSAALKETEEKAKEKEEIAQADAMDAAADDGTGEPGDGKK